MKLFVFAALVAAASAARLEHLERSYLPPDNRAQNGNGFGSGNNRFGVSGHSSNGFESNDGDDVFGSNNQGSFGVGSNGQSGSLASNRFGASQGSNSNGLNKNAGFEVATSNQYLPPVQGQSGSEAEPNSFGNLGSSISPACISCGAYNQYNQGVQSQVPSSNYGVPQLGSRSGSPSVESNGFESQSGSQGFGSQAQIGAANRQYLAPKYSAQNPPQQPFDEKTGYIY
ncbi:unnamed protein product [Danaus chrysippus]|uniref:(African queen) hypothetical protein n=1 Tax=Danaus chrysippus TaxID=151541 RepID=A0A8J2QJ89_9NEOP|nr:unnamed protein product [Danaus chrysippus]